MHLPVVLALCCTLLLVAGAAVLAAEPSASLSKEQFDSYLEAANRLFDHHVTPDESGKVRHSFNWVNPKGGRVSMMYEAQLHASALSVDLGSASGIVAIKSWNEHHIRVSSSSPIDWTPVKVIFSHEKVLATKTGFSQVLHRVLTASTVETSTTGFVYDVEVRPTDDVKQCFQSMKAEFHADNAADLMVMNTVYQASRSGSHRKRSLLDTDTYGPYENTFQLYSWNYDPYTGSSTGDYSLYSDGGVDITCSECYISITAPITVSLAWGPDWDTFDITGTGGLAASMNFEIVAQFSDSYSDSFSQELFSVTPISDIPVFYVIYLSIDITMSAGAAFSAEGQITASTGFDAYASISSSVEMNNANDPDITVSSPQRELDHEYHPLTISYDASATIEVTLPISINFNFALLGYIEVTAEPKLTIDLASSSSGSCEDAVSYDIFFEIDPTIAAQAQVGLTYDGLGKKWESSKKEFDLPVVGPYSLGSGCLSLDAAVVGKEQVPQGGDAVPSASADVSTCPSCVTQSVSVNEEVTVDTCSIDQQRNLRTYCSTPSSTNAHVWIGTVTLDRGTYVIDTSQSSFVTAVQIRDDSCCGTYKKCVYQAGKPANTELIVVEQSTYVIEVGGATATDCGTLHFSVKPSAKLLFFVDCGPAGSDSASGNYTHPFATVQHALDVSGQQWDSSTDTEATIVLKPGAEASCAYIAPATGWVIPSAIGNDPVIVTALNGDSSAVSLYASHLRRCSASTSPNPSNCVTEQQFSAMAYGTAYDTFVQCTSVGSSCQAFSPLSSGNLVLKGLGFESVNSDQSGSVLNSNGATVDIQNCIFRSSTSTGSAGGSLRCSGGTVSLTGVVSIGSTAATGGFLAAYDGCSVTISSCKLLESLAHEGSGGAIFLQDATASIFSTSFVENSANIEGGAIAAQGTDSSLTLTACTFVSNEADHFGGGIAVKGGAQLTTSTLVVQRNVAELYGGAVAAMGKGTKWTDSNSKIEQNASPAVYAFDGATVQFASTVVYENSPVGIVNAAFASSRPGALMCAYATVVGLNSTTIYGSLDPYGGEGNNIACVGCTGCSACDSCSGCGRCTSSGCDPTYLTTGCIERFGSNYTCDGVSAYCVAVAQPTAPVQPVTPVTPPAPNLQPWTAAVVALAVLLGVSLTVVVIACIRMKQLKARSSQPRDHSLSLLEKP